MSEGFKRFKKKVVLNTYFKSILFGLSFGIAAISALLIIEKLRGVGIDILYYIIAGAGGAAVVWGLTFLILRQSDKNISRKIDGKLHLGEKAQTMLEFEGDDSAMAALQREDADEILKRASTKGFLFRKVWVGCITFILACGVLATGILIPRREAPDPYREGFELTDYQLIALKELIEHVKASDMTANVKDGTVRNLEGLLEDLIGIEYDDEKKAKVTKSIEYIWETVDNVTAYEDISTQMKESRLDNMVKLDTALSELSSLPQSTALDELALELSKSEAGNLASSIDRFCSEFGIYIRNYSQNIPLHVTLSEFRVQLNDIASNLTSGTYKHEEGQNKLLEVFESFKMPFYEAMSGEMGNTEERDYVISELMRLFGIATTDLSDSEDSKLPNDYIENIDPEEPKRDDEESDSSGGVGDGHLVFGSNDEIYDYNKEERVQYGHQDVIYDYNKKKEDFINDGNVPEDIKDYITSYWDMLF